MSKWKNYGLWASLFSLIGLLLQAMGIFKKLGLTNDMYNAIISAFLSLLAGAGIISNPDSGKWFGSNQDSTNDNDPPSLKE